MHKLKAKIWRRHVLIRYVISRTSVRVSHCCVLRL